MKQEIQKQIFNWPNNLGEDLIYDGTLVASRFKKEKTWTLNEGSITIKEKDAGEAKRMAEDWSKKLNEDIREA